MPFAGCFDGHEFDLVANSQRLSCRMPVPLLATAAGCLQANVSVEPVFAHIDACGTFASGFLFGRFLALHAGRAPNHLLRTRVEDGRTKLPHGPKNPKGIAVPPIRIKAGGHRP